MSSDVETANLWTGARAIWSQWDGYLKDGPGAKVVAELAERGVPLKVIHTSGHADIVDLKRLVQAIARKRLVPIHTFDSDRFANSFPMLRAARTAIGGRSDMHSAAVEHTLSEGFMSDLKDGFLSPLREKARRDDTLMIGLRDSNINLYYRGGSIMKLTRLF